VSSASEPLASKTLSERLGFRPAVVELGHTHPSVRRVLGRAGGTLSFLVTLDDDVTLLDPRIIPISLSTFLWLR
jgi:hypothetical protein